MSLDFEALVQDGLDVSRASAAEYFGTIPFALHHVGLIYAKLGEAGVQGLGQPTHIDVQLPELVCFHYLLGGVATAVYKPEVKVTPQQQSKHMLEVTGYTLGELVQSPPTRHHLTYHAAAPLMLPDVLERMGPATSSGVVRPGDNLRVIGSWPHAGGPPPQTNHNPHLPTITLATLTCRCTLDARPPVPLVDLLGGVADSSHGPLQGVRAGARRRGRGGVGRASTDP